MMNCQTYVFKLSSGQLEEASLGERLWATQHRLMCSKCRAFTANDRLLTDVMARHKADMQTPEPPEDDVPGDAGGPDHPSGPTPPNSPVSR